jgi:stress-induced-phosphoprotein 1
MSAEAQKMKQEGNDAYKKKDFDTALSKYGKAIDLDPNEITYYLNTAAVHFEMKNYTECVSTCNKAIDVGRENRADFKHIAKALARMGNAYRKSGDLKNAKMAYEKALTEHRTPDYKLCLSEIEVELKKSEELAYVNPEIAEEEKLKGNNFFKSGDFSNAVKTYTEAIKRNPTDPKIYSNRAACFTKLMSFDLAIKDCDKCIELEPNFVKAYLRKAKAHQALSQASKAMNAYEKALEIDPNCSEAIDGYKACSISNNSNPEEVRKQAMNDPEVQKILNDPAMRMILEQMQSDPQAIQEHLKNPKIAENFMKLREAGLISVAYK